MEKTNFILYGAGGHAAVVEAAAICCGDFEIVTVLDDGKQIGEKLVNAKISGGFEKLAELFNMGTKNVHVAVGNNKIRETLFQEIKNLNFEILSIRHPSAVIETASEIGEGTFVAAQAVVGTRTTLGKSCIINTAATVDHDNIIGDFVHICPGVNLAGDVKIGTRSMIGIGASVIQGITIGKDCVIGAGAVVIRDVPDGITVVGNPAREISVL